MTVIERWIATNPPNPEEYTAGWEPKALDSEKTAETYRRLGWEVVEVVPAEQLREAVAALREVYELAQHPGMEGDDSLDAIFHATKAALAAFGGQ